MCPYVFCSQRTSLPQISILETSLSFGFSNWKYPFPWIEPDNLPGTGEKWGEAACANIMQWKSSMNCCTSQHERILPASLF